MRAAECARLDEEEAEAMRAETDAGHVLQRWQLAALRAAAARECLDATRERVRSKIMSGGGRLFDMLTEAEQARVTAV